MVGLFITFEGGEGSGKTTQVQLLQHAFIAAGKKCSITREPGGCAGAEAIRELLLTGAGDKWTPIAETLLFQAARVEHVECVIKPALARDEIVLCDRFLDSTLVYQGIGKGLSEAYIAALHQMTLGDFTPDMTFILDIDPALGLKRASKRHGSETRFENMDIAFHHKVREGFLTLAKRAKQRCHVIDASQHPDKVQAAILQALKTHSCGV